MILPSLIATALILGQVSAFSAFGNVATFGLTKDANSSPPRTVLFGSVAGKYFQLEEMEDKDGSCTEIFLSPYRTVSIRVTDGPMPKSSSGTWEQSADERIKMTIARTYEGGENKFKDSDMGEFSYTVQRSYIGELEDLGDFTGFTGSIHQMDDRLGDFEVGFFKMLDTTDVKDIKNLG
eukprot:CAMPEP_0195538570 /NCGR_PEP_ID=MMETSP0794_2-20130614/49600_1 /TAXON_ID=515487 /ORGANISM="Stephanopyxis turris, Strain CCMP 815" /LENGTH=178 /DNA_ID=CAMNT_0040672561 /DNA_START=601 /DNA_END=1137 /DNA_ORIENTATION=+